MKLSRKLIPAMIMLLVSAVLMSTASFAWFSTNTKAEASGFSVKIAAAQNLLIKDAEGSVDYAPTLTFTDAKKEGMIPGSTAIDTTPEFWIVSKAGGITPGSAEAKADTEFAKDESGKSFLKKTVNLRATGEYGKDLKDFGDVKTTITVTDHSDSDLDPCLRVLMVVTTPGVGEASPTKAAYVFAPMTGYDDECVPVIGFDSDAEAGKKIQYAEAAPQYTSSTDGVVISKMVKDTEYTVEIYIYYEGQDAACTANNAINIGALEVKIAFTMNAVA